MSILSAKRLSDLLVANDPAERLVVTPLLDENQLVPGAGAIDIRLGNHVVLPRRTHLAHLDPKDPGFNATLNDAVETAYVPFGEPVILHPRQFILGATLEYVRLPANIAAHVVSRSTWGRLGLVVATATFVQPGFFGVLVLEMTNLAEVPISVYPGIAAVQLIFEEVSGVDGELGAMGKYLGATDIQLPRISREEMDQLRRLES